jgi:hypothetical protein
MCKASRESVLLSHTGVRHLLYCYQAALSIESTIQGQMARDVGYSCKTLSWSGPCPRMVEQ